MEKQYKTRTASEILGVNPTTVQRWIKYFNIPCETNEQGHYLIVEKQLELLRGIKEKLNNGMTMKEIYEKEFEGYPENLVKLNKAMIPAENVEERLEQLMIHIEQLERKLSVKADEVVEYQVLQHRSELDSLFSMVSKIEERMSKMEHYLVPTEKRAVGGEATLVRQQLSKPRKNKIMKMFSF